MNSENVCNHLEFLFLAICFSYNASKESLPVETPTAPQGNQLGSGKLKNLPHRFRRPETTIHDDFSDLMDYILLDSSERAKHRIDVDRVHPVIQKSMEGDLVRVDNPSIADLMHIQIR